MAMLRTDSGTNIGSIDDAAVDAFIAQHPEVARVLGSAALELPRFFSRDASPLPHLQDDPDGDAEDSLIGYVLAPMPRESAREALHSFRREWWRQARGDRPGRLFFTLP